MGAELWPAATFCASPPSWHDPHIERMSRRNRSRAMNERIDQFREIFRIKLMQADSDLSTLKAKIDAKAETAERDVRAYLAAVAKRIQQSEPQAKAARAEVEKWANEQRTAATAAAAALKAKGETVTLKARADVSERYALALPIHDDVQFGAWAALGDFGRTGSFGYFTV
jgi:hypothetical protein